MTGKSHFGRQGHPDMLLLLAGVLLVGGILMWFLGYFDNGQHPDRLADLGGGIVAGAVVSVSFWLLDRATAERETAREQQDQHRHDNILAALSDGRAATGET